RLRPFLGRLSSSERLGLKNATQIAAIAQASQACKSDNRAKRLMFLTIRGWRPHLAIETLIAAHLRQMGHDVSFLICAKSLPFCMFCPNDTAEDTDQNCFGCCESKTVLPGPYFETDELSCSEESKQAIQAKVAHLTIEQCRQFEWDGIPYGELVYPSVVWFVRRSKLTDSDAVWYRKALIAAHISRLGLERVVGQRNPDTV